MPDLTDPHAATRSGTRSLAMLATTPTSAAYAAAGREMLPAVSSGIATQFWAELIAYPSGSARSLWLLVAGAWKRYDNASAHMEDMIQRAFAMNQTVQVWFDGEQIVGLVVNT